MKKIFFSIIILLFLTSCFNKKIEEEKINTGSLGSGITEKKIDKTIYGKTKEELAYRIEEKENRVNILPNDISNIYIGKEIQKQDLEKNPVLKNGVDFINGLKNNFSNKITENRNGGIEYSDYEEVLSKSKKEFIREFNLYLEIKDHKTNEKIKKGFVYLNNIKFGEFSDGKFEKKFKWPLGIEKFVVMIRVDGYGDSFINLNSLNNDGNLIYGEIFIKKSLNKTVKLGKKVEIGNLAKNNYLIEIPECALVNNKGECYKGEVEVISNHISGEDVNAGLTSLNMVGVDDNGKYWDLFSGGMAFNDFITKEGEILKIGEGKKIRVTYKLSDKLMIAFSDLGTAQGNEGKNGYWIYDKNDMIWKLSKDKPTIDKERNLWIVETSDLY